MSKTSINKQIRLDDVRASFLHIYETDNYGRFSGSFIFAPDHPAAAAISAAIKEVAASKWGQKAEGILKKLGADDKLCLKDGSKKLDKEGNPVDGYEGNLFVTSSNDKAQPTSFDRDGSKLDPKSGKPYSGCQVNAKIEIWAQDNSYGQRINATLLGVQFMADGEAFGGGGRTADASDFEQHEPETDNEALGVDQPAETAGGALAGLL